MKITTKSSPNASESATAVSQDFGSESSPTSGGTQAHLDHAVEHVPASKAPMMFPGVDHNRIQRQLVTIGFRIPRIELPARVPWLFGWKLRFSFQSTTLAAPDDQAEIWLQAFEAREIGTGGVAAIKSRIRLDVETIRRWLKTAD